MPFPIVAAALGGASILGGILGSRSASRAADAQTAAADQAAELQRRNMLMQANIYEPQRGVGYQALGDLASLYGYNVPAYTNIADLTRIINGGAPGTTAFDNVTDLAMNPAPGIGGAAAGSIQGFLSRLAQQRSANAQSAASPVTAQPAGQPGNFSRFFTSPDYQFRFNEAMRGAGRSSAARSGTNSPAVSRELMALGGNLASAEYGNYFNRLAQMSGMGQVANQSVGGAAGNYAANAGNALMQAGDARASGVMGQNDAWQNALGYGLGGWIQSRQPSGGGWQQPVMGGYQWTWPGG